MSNRTTFAALALLVAGSVDAQSIKPMGPEAIAQIRRGAPPPVTAAEAQVPTSAITRAASTTVTSSPLPTAAPSAQPDAAEAGEPTAAAPKPKKSITTIPAGTRLSTGLEAFVKSHGWSIRWLIDEDYMLDADLPVPADDVIEGVTFVVQTYQKQGGMQGVVPLFAKGNQVVAIQKMDVRDVE
jgi:hypothetical protein